MAKGLRIAEPPPRRPIEVEAPAPPQPGEKFSQVREIDRVQFNKRVTRGVADGFEMLAIRTRRKVPELLAEALELLQQRYGKV
jgi:hypothetical protein